MIQPPDDAARRGAFAAMMAHELRTPLTAAFGALEMMSRAAASPAGGRDAVLIDLAHRNTHRLLRIVEDCLDLEAASDGRLTLDRERVEPGEIVALGVDGARSTREQTGIDVMLQLDARGSITGDRPRLGRALAHLVRNAVTFAPPGTVVTVATTDDPERGMVRFVVEDHGVGIEPEQCRALFQRFDVREAAGRRRVGGLGLGLAYVRMVAEEHRGAVAVRAQPGCTRIAFEVPAVGS
ncbi:MAG: HAMP domain-containing histidine kinase [Gemmatimonadaceae bacterium]|nr:HAMP domain-containing histidine kinase [Gemmatimonadaceae bacterium]NUP54258.1 HAMP domain-containing histidine kinase [Gemmatimonadaceae bacterium]NUP70650.1 HAMP domain-containing histidine kinase [Gemmatimonadaceae bacterium]